MVWHRTSTVGPPPADPVAEVVAEVLTEMLAGATVELSYAPDGDGPMAPGEPPAPDGDAAASGAGPAGWRTTVSVHLDERVDRLAGAKGERAALAELVNVLPAAGIAAATPFRQEDPAGRAPPSPALRRALRDTLAAEVLARYLATRLGRPPRADLVPETIEYLIELSGTRVESHDLTHGVLIADVTPDTPRLSFRYPADVRAAKRAPLLFDGQRSLLVVDPEGRARTELQRHRFRRLAPGAGPAPVADADSLQSGALVAEATACLGGLGFFVRADRSIWTFVDGQPLLVRRGEHWTAFPLELSARLETIIGGGQVAGLVAGAAFRIAAQPRGAILAVVDGPDRLEGVVSAKDRFDLRNDIDPAAMRTETRLHHLIDAEDLDERTLVRLAALDGATVLDRTGRLLAYGAIVTSGGSEHEGARTAAARTLSETADVVLKVSVDGDITVFRDGAAVTTLLGRGA